MGLGGCCFNAIPRASAVALRAHHEHHQQQQQQQQQPPPTKLRPEIAPSVLRALQQQQQQQPPPPPQPQSLIEKNLLKRAAARRGHSHSQSSPPVDNGAEVCSREQQTIDCVFWEEIPEDMHFPNFLTLDRHVALYRISLVSHILDVTDLSLSSLIWFALPSGFLSSEPPALPSALVVEWAKWRRAITVDLGKVAEDSQVYADAALSNQQFWQHPGAPDISQQQVSLNLVLVLTLVVELLEAVRVGAAGGEGARAEERLEECSAALGGALRALQADVLDAGAVWEKALKGSGWEWDGRVFVYEQGLIFPARSGKGHDDAGGMLEQVQRSLDEEYPGKVALVQRSTRGGGELFVVIAPWYWLLSPKLEQWEGLEYLLLAISCIATTQFRAADAGLMSGGMAWESCIVPLGFGAVLASVVLGTKRISHSIPFFFPVPHLGALGKFTLPSGLLPNRACFLDLVSTASCASLLTSALLLAFGFAFWGPPHYHSAAVIDFHGYVLVPPDLFSYSSVFTNILDSVSVATITVDDGSAARVTSPLALAGLLGFNFTAFSLFPAVYGDGILLVRALLGSARLAKNICLACSAMMIVSLFSKNPALGFCWLGYTVAFASERYVKDEVSEPDLFKRTIVVALVTASIACFIPVLV